MKRVLANLIVAAFVTVAVSVVATRPRPSRPPSAATATSRAAPPTGPARRRRRRRCTSRIPSCSRTASPDSTTSVRSTTSTACRTRLARTGTTSSSPRSTRTTRARFAAPSCATQVQTILNDTGAEKVNLICHSQGALDCRYVANQLGKRIGAVVLVAGVNRGDVVADVATGAVQGSVADAVNLLLDALRRRRARSGRQPEHRRAGGDQPARRPPAATRSTPSIPTIPTSPTSRSPGAPRTAAATSTAAPRARRRSSSSGIRTTGPVNALLSGTAALIDGSASVPPTNDGLVTVASAKWGTFLGCVPADHLAEVCQIGGQSSGSSYDCVTMYRDIANWLVATGF